MKPLPCVDLTKIYISVISCSSLPCSTCTIVVRRTRRNNNQKKMKKEYRERKERWGDKVTHRHGGTTVPENSPLFFFFNYNYHHHYQKHYSYLVPGLVCCPGGKMVSTYSTNEASAVEAIDSAKCAALLDSPADGAAQRVFTHSSKFAVVKM